MTETPSMASSSVLKMLLQSSQVKHTPHNAIHEFIIQKLNRPFPSFRAPLNQNEVKCSAFDVEEIFYSQANKTHFHKKGCALGLILKVGVFGTRKWPIRW